MLILRAPAGRPLKTEASIWVCHHTQFKIISHTTVLSLGSVWNKQEKLSSIPGFSLGNIKSWIKHPAFWLWKLSRGIDFCFTCFIKLTGSSILGEEKKDEVLAAALEDP